MMRALPRRLERSLAASSRRGREDRGWQARGTRPSFLWVKEPAEGPGHRPIPVCPVQNCEKPREVATRGRSGARRCGGRIFPDDGKHDGRGLRGFCEQRSPNLRVVRGPRGVSLGCKAEGRRRGGRRSSWGRTVRRSARRFRRGRRIRSARAGDQRRARWRRGNREYAVCRAAVAKGLRYLLMIIYQAMILHGSAGR